MELEWCSFKRCPLCDTTEFRGRYRLDSLAVIQCASCKLLFLNPYLSPQSMLQVYSSTEAMQGARGCLSRYYDHWDGSQTERFQRMILGEIERFRPPGTLLDIGCGRGHFLSLAVRLGWKVRGVEPAQEHAEYGRRQLGLDIVCVKLEEAEFKDHGFDVITLWDVIEHVSNPRAIIARVSPWLKEKGLLLLATPNHQSLLNFIAQGIYRGSGGRVKKPLSFFYVPEHILYFTPPTLRRLVRAGGFKVVREIKTGTDIDRYSVSTKVKLAARVLLRLATLLHLENRAVFICEKS